MAVAQKSGAKMAPWYVEPKTKTGWPQLFNFEPYPNHRGTFSEAPSVWARPQLGVVAKPGGMTVPRCAVGSTMYAKPWHMGVKEVPSNPILSRDPDLSRIFTDTQGKWIRFLKRRLVEKNGKGINP